MKWKPLESQFEDAVVEVLQQDYDLAVRHGREKLDRRARETGVLEFQYHHEDESSESKVVISVRGENAFSTMLTVDFRDEDSITRSAEECEALALYLMEHLSERREDLLADIATNGVEYGRREDDLL